MDNGKYTLEQMAEDMNTIGRFCGVRDVEELTSEQLYQKFGIAQADVMVLYGGSILCGGDVMAQAMKNGIAKKYVIAGGAGHTTETLRVKMHEEFPDISTAGRPEADIFAEYIKYRYDLEADYLETESTNAGNNITFVLELLKEKNISFNSIIIMQDGAIQRRMDACLRKYVEKDINIINYAVYQADVVVKNNELVYEDEIFGMWEIKRYLSLLLGEIQRLTNDENGYGPLGKDFNVHVDIPDAVKTAFEGLCREHSGLIRKADSSYAK